MPKTHFVEDLKRRENQEIEDLFAVAQVERRTTRDGNVYLVARLRDRTGEVEASAFDQVEALEPVLVQGEVVWVRGRVERFNQNLRIKVQDARKPQEGQVDLADYLPATPRDIQELLREARALLNTLKNPHLRRLFRQMLEDPEFLRKLLRAPAATTYHHNYLGGLLEHTLNILKMADTLSRIYPHLDRDLLLAGAFLHDIGKLEEYEITPAGIEVTDRGRLLGHILLGVEILNRYVRRLRDFPQELLMRLQHMILSHHGELEWGAPVRPALVEAQVLHFLDNLDARIWMFAEAARHPRAPGSRWSEWWKPLGRMVFIPPAPEDEREDLFG